MASATAANGQSFEWRRIRVSSTELCLDTTLRCGQSFRWRKERTSAEEGVKGEGEGEEDNDGVWTCALRGRLLRLRQDDDFLYYNVTWPDQKGGAESGIGKKKAGAAKKAPAGSRKRKSNPRLPPTTAQQGPLTPPASVQENGPSSAAPAGAEDTKPTDLSSSFTPNPTDNNRANDDDDDDTEAFLTHYLNLTPNLSALYAQWSSADKNFASKAPRFTGIRILKQDAWEALTGFICSSNNNIARISQMMEKLCLEYGPRIGQGTPGTTAAGTFYHDLPPPSALAHPAVEQRLRDLGFGYRAKYLHRTAQILVEKESERSQAGISTKLSWLDSLRNPESPAFGSGVPPAPAGELLENGRDGYRDAHEQLLELQGVGPKVADCVCLMGLGWGEAVPVDTHVWQIAVRDYRFGGGKGGKNASMTRATYEAVGNHFRKLWGKEAGWAHSVLFAADLRVFRERLRGRVEVTEEVVRVKNERGGEVKEEDEEREQAAVVKVEETVAVEVVQLPRGKRRAAAAVKVEEDVEPVAVVEEKTTVRTTRAKRRRQG